MRHPILLALALTVLTANKCRNEGPTMADLLNTRWEFRTVDGQAVAMPADVDRPWLRLTDDGVQGFGGCNRMMGGYELNDARLTFPGLATTRMYCEAVQKTENAITKALSEVDNYTFVDGLLSLRKGEQVLATLTAGADADQP
ncbi:MAG: META domain-containing protein [Flavobacteriales bacterium]|nr:META domain-containing protein [Flavobacteriales bacterium]